VHLRTNTSKRKWWERQVVPICQHIAMATLAKADILVSWNFKHIVNLDKIRGYNGINYKLGHTMIEIRTPKEIINYDDTNL